MSSGMHQPRSSQSRRSLGRGLESCAGACLGCAVCSSTLARAPELPRALAEPTQPPASAGPRDDTRMCDRTHHWARAPSASFHPELLQAASSSARKLAHGCCRRVGRAALYSDTAAALSHARAQGWASTSSRRRMLKSSGSCRRTTKARSTTEPRRNSPTRRRGARRAQEAPARRVRAQGLCAPHARAGKAPGATQPEPRGAKTPGTAP